MGDGCRDHAGCRVDAGVDPQVHVLGEAGLARVTQLVRVAALEDTTSPTSSVTRGSVTGARS